MDYSQYIRDAIISGRVLRVTYASSEKTLSDLNQSQVIVIIRPLRWEGSQQFSALMSSTGDERVFDVQGIQYCQSFASFDLAREYEKRAEQGSLPPPAAVPVLVEDTRPFRAHSNASSEQTLIPDMSKIPVLSWLQSRSNRQQAIKTITNGNEWSRLLAYYTKCIEMAWIRQLVIRPDQLYAFPLDDDVLSQFFKGKTGLGFVKNPPMSEITTQFFAEYSQRAGFQLCLGYPFIFFGLDQAAPLVYTRVSISQKGEQIFLQSGKMEVSAAAARYLQVPLEEIEALLEAGDGGISIDPVQLVDFVLSKLGIGESSIINKLTDVMGAKSIFQKPALFWADLDQAENGLLHSLRAIATEPFWQSAPELLKVLFSGVSSADHRGAQARSEWEFFPVTPVSDEIRAAVEAGLVEMLSVVISPEGAQRTDLVLNMTVQSFLAGHSVLIASRSPEMVDQLLHRLEYETDFQGAVRFGNWPATKNETLPGRLGLETAASQTAASWGDELQGLLKSRREYLHADEIVENIRGLHGLKSAFSQQRERLASNLIDPWLGLSRRVLANRGMPELLSELAELLTAASDQYERIETLRAQIRQVVFENEVGCAIIEDLKAWEMHTGAAGSGFVPENIPSAIAPLQDYVQTWVWLVSAHKTRVQQVETQQSLNEAREQIADLTEKLWAGLSQKIEPLAVKHSESEMLELSNQFQHLGAQFQALIDHKPGLSEQLLAVSPLLSPMVKTVKAFDHEIHKIGLSWPPKNRLEVVDAAAYAQAAGQMSVLTRAAACLKQIDRLDVLLKRLDEPSRTFFERLPAEVQIHLANYTPGNFDTAILIQTFDQVRPELDRLAIESVEMIKRIHANLEENRLNLAVLTELWNLDEPGLAGLHLLELHPDPQTVIGYLDAWNNLARMFQLNGLIHEVDGQLAGLPSEADAARLKDGPPTQLIELNRKIFAASWLERTARLDQITRQNALSFLEVLEQTAQLPFEADPAASNPVTDAVRVFPVWVGTEWAARKALPLIPGLFDLVIVDGADQIHLAGGLSLLVRAKRAVLMGTSTAFAGAAHIDLAEDLALAKESGIDQASFSFTQHSLLDLAQRLLTGSERRLGKRAAPVILGRAAVTVDMPPEGIQVQRTSQFSLLACLDASREFIWWIDPEFNNDLINLFWDRLQQGHMLPVNEIRILTAVEQLNAPEGGNQVLHLTSLKALQAEMDDFGIQFEVRVLPKAGFPEVHFFFSKNQAVEMPSFPDVYRDRHRVSSFALAKASPDLFMQYWDQAEPLIAPTNGDSSTW